MAAKRKAAETVPGMTHDAEIPVEDPTPVAIPEPQQAEEPEPAPIKEPEPGSEAASIAAEPQRSNPPGPRDTYTGRDGVERYKDSNEPVHGRSAQK